MKDLNGKVGVVTGGAGGIGKAIGVAMLEEGMKVVLADVLDGPLQEAVQEIGSDDLIGVASDVTSYESMCALRDATMEKFGAVHVICNTLASAPEPRHDVGAPPQRLEVVDRRQRARHRKRHQRVRAHARGAERKVMS